VTAWEPPRLVAFSWNPNPEAVAFTDVEVRFAQHGDATRVELEHRGWEQLGARATEAYASYSSAGGWTLVVDCFAEAASSGG
jgi:uncharacterized protein YndB with AHSA1/START domain